MTAVDDNITPLPTLLERVGIRIDNAWQRIRAGEHQWVEGSLEAAQALRDARSAPENKAEQAFHEWLTINKHDHWNKNDRIALIGLASDVQLARVVLTETTRRSYRHIWEEVKDRFPHVGKADEPKRGRPKGQRKAKPRQTDPVKDQIIDLADQGLSSPEIAAAVGVESRAARHALEDEQIRRAAFAELLEAAAAKNFLEKGKLRIEDAIRIHTKWLDKQFEHRVNQEVRRRIDAADDATRKDNKKLRHEVMTLQRIVGQYAVFTKTQFRQMQMLCHPDSSASEQTKAELSQILVENERRLVKPEK